MSAEQPESQIESEKPTEQSLSESKESKSIELDKELERARIHWGKMFDESKDPRGTAQAMLNVIRPTMEKAFKDKAVIEGIEEGFKACESITNREEFLDETFEAMRPLLEFRQNNPKEFQEISRKIAWGYIFDKNNGDAKETVREILETELDERNIAKILKFVYTPEEKARVENLLQECEGITDREGFLQKIASIVIPILELRDRLKAENPREFERVSRDIHLDDRFDIIRLSEVLYCDKNEEGRNYDVHLDQARTLDIIEKKKHIRAGLEKLADMVEADEKVKTVHLTSWILGKNSRLVKKWLGFNNMRLIDEEEKKKRSLREDMPVGEMVVTREDFLKRPWREGLK